MVRLILLLKDSKAVFMLSRMLHLNPASSALLTCAKYMLVELTLDTSVSRDGIGVVLMVRTIYVAGVKML